MSIHIGDKTKEHMERLGIDNFPFTAKELSSKFKAKIHIAHEDKGGSNGAARKVLEAREFLKNLVQENLDRGYEVKEHIEEDMFSNPETCSHCNGRGNHFGRGRPTRPCLKCKGRGRVEKAMFNPVIPKGAILF